MRMRDTVRKRHRLSSTDRRRSAARCDPASFRRHRTRGLVPAMRRMRIRHARAQRGRALEAHHIGVRLFLQARRSSGRTGDGSHVLVVRRLLHVALERLRGVDQHGADDERHPEHDAAIHQTDGRASRRRFAEAGERHHDGRLDHADALRRDRDHGEQRCHHVTANQRRRRVDAEPDAHQREARKLAQAGDQRAPVRLKRRFGAVADHAGRLGKRLRDALGPRLERLFAHTPDHLAAHAFGGPQKTHKQIGLFVRQDKQRYHSSHQAQYHHAHKEPHRRQPHRNG